MNGVKVLLLGVLSDGSQAESFGEEVASFEAEVASFSCSFQFSDLHHNASYLFSKS
jgi:hypothetical protein